MNGRLLLTVVREMRPRGRPWLHGTPACCCGGGTKLAEQTSPTLLPKQTNQSQQQRLPNRRAPTPKLQPHAATLLHCCRYVQVLMLTIINTHADIYVLDCASGLHCTRGTPSASGLTTSSNRATASLSSGLLIQGSTSRSCRSFRVSFLRGVCFGGDWSH